ncbi:iron-sulfur cluster-binding domain-containing protein [Loigolactobacillus bifermentans]|uniref:Oxidoreductase n=1 Tax=Loigolactobacillus bifermentans DSM 20003 TaxID=1423726 RepID=A0A0R1GGH1_9LACO|nr:iron-sulfur cluster-binding domain-containing protein [Loigolactobacillus bifermentans]KRK33325.1 oxidoreductase [Loigolactobacillus bifermentans DSM 20003]QGG60829.1 2Fe-2S iron-sulfur cluster binding domain-containing protein [Loigolactobacillus bifermentans]
MAKQTGLAALDQIKQMRAAKIAAAPATPLTTQQLPMNQLAQALHPESQYLRIVKVIEHFDNARSYVLEPDTTRGTQHLAYFRAGQYLSVRLQIEQSYVTRAYAIRSAPALALKDQYVLTIKLVPNGFVTPYIFKNWQVGTQIETSAPAGELYVQPLRDQSTIVGLAGGSGITPFYALAQAIVDGTESVDLTLLYGSRTHDQILLDTEFDQLVQQSDRIKVVHVLSDEQVPGYESGFITADLIRKYAPTTPYSIFVCGPEGMYQFIDQEVLKLKLPAGRVRHELSGNGGAPDQLPGYPQTAKGKVFQMTVLLQDKTRTIPARSDESVLVAMERAGIVAPSLCRSGDCGICRSRLVTGEVFAPIVKDGRRKADQDYGYIHTCVTYPTSDLTVEVPIHDLADQFG